jgi:hypothetical protein
MLDAKEARRLMIVARAEKIPEIFALIKNAMYSGLDRIELTPTQEVKDTLQDLGYDVQQIDAQGTCRVFW